MSLFPTLYKIDTKGKVREWRMEVEGNRYRTIAGLQNGKQVTSEWTIAEAKNAGRANATTAEEQAIAEVQSQYTKKLDVDYHYTVDTIKQAKIFKPMLADKWESRKDKIQYPVFVQAKLDGCVSGDTVIVTEKGSRKISDVYADDDRYVLSYNTIAGESEFKRIINKMKDGVDIRAEEIYWMRITLANDRSIEVTSNHRFWLPQLQCWREAKDLTLDDILLLTTKV